MHEPAITSSPADPAGGLVERRAPGVALSPDPLGAGAGAGYLEITSGELLPDPGHEIPLLNKRQELSWTSQHQET
ncbi:hypothetical protein IFHNHDMJ_00394 [Synechococcus sp. CBW1107]|nr:hypothetical protein IFHNHDMJ_00394 [Synechococcus sp. CBW1107]